MKQVGIERLSWYVPDTYLDMGELAEVRGVEAAKYTAGLGQDQMAVVPPDEDPVTMAVHAAAPLVDAEVRRRLLAVIVASESGVDASKSMAVFVHGLLGMPSNCLAWDVQQACAGSTAAMIQARALVQAQPNGAVLVIATDEARYELGSPAEPTQGAGACAMIVSDRPNLVRFHGTAHANTVDVNDFWRPPGRETALVDGRLSVATYIAALKACRAGLPNSPGTWTRALFHLPFTRMAAKAARVLDLPPLAWHSGTLYGRRIGNTYTAALYIALSSLLEQDEEHLGGSTIGAFAYGSGATGILQELVVAPDYRQHLRVEQHRARLDDRRRISVSEYEAWRGLAAAGETVADPGNVSKPAIVRFAGIEGWARRYVKTNVDVARDVIGEVRSGNPSRSTDRTENH